MARITIKSNLGTGQKINLNIEKRLFRGKSVDKFKYTAQVSKSQWERIGKTIGWCPNQWDIIDSSITYKGEEYETLRCEDDNGIMWIYWGLN